MLKIKTIPSLSTVGAFALILVLLAGCGCFPCNDDSFGGKTYLQLAPLSPPPDMYEAVPQGANSRTTTWRPGYWDFGSGNFTWVSGEIIARPSATAVWSPDHWNRHTFGWGFVPGHWQ